MKFFILTSCLILSGTSIAADKKLFDSSQPVTLKSKHISVNQKNGGITYKGNVRLKQGNLLIRAAKAKTKTVGKQPSQVWASGNPAKVQSKRNGNLLVLTASNIHYNIKSGMITLTDNVQLTIGGDVLGSKQLSYNVKTNKIIVNTEDSPLNASFDSEHIKSLNK